jgi:hypothetical protein|tara:strand:+ start:40 stop:210 length:171 start_codon:yes stop_codon:yes gene_type:complete
MKKYKVTVVSTQTEVFEVEATNEEKAEDEVMSGNFTEEEVECEITDWNITSVNKIA